MRYSLFVIRYSLFVIRYSLFVIASRVALTCSPKFEFAARNTVCGRFVLGTKDDCSMSLA